MADNEDYKEAFKMIRKNSKMFKFNGRGQAENRLITYEGAINFIMVAPGVNPAIRTKFADVLKRYFAGDPTLIWEIAENNQSNADINQAARDGTDIPQFKSMEELEAYMETKMQEKIEAAIPSLLEKLQVDFKKQRSVTVADSRLAAKRTRENMELENSLTIKKMMLVEQFKENDHKRFLERKQVEKESKDHDIQYQEKKIKLHRELNDIPVTTTTTTTTTTGGVPPVTPCTICRVAKAFNLMDGIPEDRAKGILQEAGNHVRVALDPLPEKVPHLYKAFPVMQYDPGFTQTLKDAIEACIRNEKKKFNKMVDTKANTIFKYTCN